MKIGWLGRKWRRAFDIRTISNKPYLGTATGEVLMPMQEREYRIDFFQLTIVANGEIGDVQDALEAIVRGDIPSVNASDGYTREIFNLQHRRRPSSFAGQFRKFRTSDLPEVGITGAQASELELMEGQGLIERNFFVYYRQHSLIGWHINGHGSTPKQLSTFLTQVTGQKVRAEPIPIRGALDRLMAGNVVAKKITATIARPTNAQALPDDDYGDEYLRMLSGVGGDTMHIAISIDSRRGDSAGELGHKAKDLLRAFAAFGATTARAEVIEDGIEHPIDLILDRVKTVQYEESDAKYPPAPSMFAMIDRSHRESRADFEAHFGEGDDVLE